MTLFDRSLVEKIKAAKGEKICVLGDLVCDHYIFGRTKRVSREAPVLILEYDHEYLSLGGAANAVNNIREMGAEVEALGVVGNDDNGRGLVGLLKDRGVNTGGIILDQSRPTTVKERIMGSALHTTFQQMIRIDNGTRRPVSGDVEATLLDHLEQAAENCKVIVISDYGYGTVSPKLLDLINKIAKQGNTPVLVDSRYRVNRFKNPYLITPNEPEAEQATEITIREDSDVVQAAQKLKQLTDAVAICITRGKLGMYLSEKGQPDKMLPIFGPDEVTDVTGAGDTVMAAFAVSIAAQCSLYDGARFATIAAGLSVMKAGTATVTLEEMTKALDELADE